MKNKEFVSGNEAIAIGVRLAKPDVIAAYPITPQTVVVERLAEMFEDGSLKAEFMNVESEHSALSAMIGASAVGARTFTATSSQGLLYMAECLHYSSGGRFPVVMMNANRSLALPWSIYGDQRDSLSLLDSGWIQVYVEDCQEALDMVIQAYRIAEDKDVLTPFMINLDGFVLTHTYSPVDVPEQKDVDEFLPAFETVNKMDFIEPKNMGFSTSPNDNMEFKYMQHRAMIRAKKIIQKTEEDFGKKFGRSYGGLVEAYRAEDAQTVLITLGSLTGTARIAVDELREKGEKAGLLKLRYLRPFPEEEIAEALKNAKAIGVLEKDVSFGYEGTVFTNVNSALKKAGNNSQVSNFIAGLGGRAVLKNEIHEIFVKLKKGSGQKINFVNLGVKDV